MTTAPLTVDVWWADLTQADLSLARTLPSAERERAMAPQRPADRGRRLVAASLLQLAAGRPVEVDRTCEECGQPHGRPVVQGGPHVSVAHSGVLVVVATCVSAVLGVDVEQTGRFAGSAADTLAWTRREAAVKAGVTSGTSTDLRAPLPGYAAALCVSTGGRLVVTEHHLTRPAG